MAYLEKRDKGWMAQIRRMGRPTVSKTFQTKADAEKWSRAVEREIDLGGYVRKDESASVLFEEVAKRYLTERIVNLRGADQDTYRIHQLIEHFSGHSLAAIDPAMLAAYRDARLKVVKPQTLIHELNLISRVFNTCAMDWGMSLPRGNPVALTRMPALSNARDRTLTPREEEYLLSALLQPSAKSAGNRFTHPIVVLAIETAARRSELLSLTWSDVVDFKWVRLRGKDGGVTKNKDPFRVVPLSLRAAEILKALAVDGKNFGPVFPVTLEAFKQSWTRGVVRGRKNYVHDVLRTKLMSAGFDGQKEISAVVYKKRQPHELTCKLLVEIEQYDKTLVDLRFHDLRHHATSKLAGIFEMHELMKISGHKTSRMLARYYHPKAEDLSEKLLRGTIQN